jgi:hypothetical protein
LLEPREHRIPQNARTLKTQSLEYLRNQCSEFFIRRSPAACKQFLLYAPVVIYAHTFRPFMPEEDIAAPHVKLFTFT